MLPTMMIGDYLFVAKWPYGYSRFSLPFGLGSFDGRILADTPDRGDIAVFRYPGGGEDDYVRSEEHTSELQSLMRISYAVSCLKKKTNSLNKHTSQFNSSIIEPNKS